MPLSYEKNKVHARNWMIKNKERWAEITRKNSLKYYRRQKCYKEECERLRNMLL